MRPLIALGVLAATLALAGCSGSDDPPGGGAPASAPGGSAPASAGTPGATTPASGQPTPAPGGSDPAGSLGDPVARRTASLDGAKLSLVVYPVVRDGTVSHLNVEVAAPGSGTRGVDLDNLLTDDNAATSDVTPWAADGFQLVDGRHAKLYLVASDGHGHCLCSRGLTEVSATASTPALVSATFAAPPADVSTVDLRIPRFGTVTGVPVR